MSQKQSKKLLFAAFILLFTFIESHLPCVNNNKLNFNYVIISLKSSTLYSQYLIILWFFSVCSLHEMLSWIRAVIGYLFAVIDSRDCRFSALIGPQAITVGVVNNKDALFIYRSAIVRKQSFQKCNICELLFSLKFLIVYYVKRYLF